MLASTLSIRLGALLGLTAALLARWVEAEAEAVDALLRAGQGLMST